MSEQRMNRSRRSSANRPNRGRAPSERRPEVLYLYGIHPALAALSNPAREIRRVWVTLNAKSRIEGGGVALPAETETVLPRDLDRLLGPTAVHQGIALEVAPLAVPDLDDLARMHLVVCLDQVSDPHNVGAILRSTAAFGGDAVISTARHAPVESAVLAKSASGAFDMIPLVAVQNLARTLDSLGERGFVRIGLAEEADMTLEEAMAGEQVALVLGAEGKGLRRLTRDTCDRLARLPTSGPLASLNVSNAAALALYEARRHLDRGNEDGNPAAGEHH